MLHRVESTMNETEKHVINQMQRDFERSLSLTPMFLKQFLDRNVLTQEAKNDIMKQDGKTKKFLSYIQKVPGSFSILVEILKKDRSCCYIACELENKKKKREHFLCVKKQKRKEKQQMKAQDALSQQISERLAFVVNGAKIQCTDTLSLLEQVNEHEKLIEKLEMMRKGLECQEGEMDQNCSLTELIETKCQGLQKRINEEMQKASDAQREAKFWRSKYESMTSHYEKNQKDLTEENEKLRSEYANMNVWQKRRQEEFDKKIKKIEEENLKKLKKGKECLEMIRSEEKSCTNKELQNQKQKYESLKELCHCGAVKHEQAVNLEDNEQESCNQGNQVPRPGHMDTNSYGFRQPWPHMNTEGIGSSQPWPNMDADGCVFNQPQLHMDTDLCEFSKTPPNMDTDGCGFSQPRHHMDTDSCGFSQPQPHNQQEYVEERPPSGSSSSSSNQSAISNINLQDNNVNKSSNVFDKKVKNLYFMQG